MDSSEVKISIIIPVYNVAPYLDVCLSSCVNQTFRDIEIIVVNDGSPDTSHRVIEKYAVMDKRIVVVNKENEGLIYARKSGLDIARGEYVFHLDGDDYIEHNALEVLYREALDKKSDYVMAGFYIVSGNDRRTDRIGEDAAGLAGQDLLAFLLEKPAWPIWGRLIRKHLFDGVIYRNIFMGEDLYLNMQVALNVKKAAVSDSCLYNYVQHKSSVMAQSFEVTLNSYLEEIESIWSLLDIYPYDERIKKKISCLFFRFFIGAVRRDKKEVKEVLRFYYWDKKDIRASLRKERKAFYFLCGGYLYVPRMTVWAVKVAVKAMIWLKGNVYDL